MKKSRIVFILLIIFIALFLLIFVPALNKAREHFGFLEATEHARFQLEDYLNGYYQTNGCYPPKLDVSVLRVYRTKSYRDALRKIEYESDSNSFHIRWKYPHPWLDSNEFMILILEGQKGEITNHEYCPPQKSR